MSRSGAGGLSYFRDVMRKRRISIMLMVCTIGAIIAYQVAWLRKSYTEEKAVFMARTNFLLRETVFMLQTAHLRTDTLTETYFDNKSGGVIVTTNVLQNKVRADSSGLLQGA